MENLLLEIHDQLIGGLMAGIPACYSIAGIRQSSGKAKRYCSKACFELCRCIGQRLYMFSSVNSYKHVFYKLSVSKNKLKSSLSTHQHFSRACVSLTKQSHNSDHYLYFSEERR